MDSGLGTNDMLSHTISYSLDSIGKKQLNQPDLRLVCLDDSLLMRSTFLTILTMPADASHHSNNPAPHKPFDNQKSLGGDMSIMYFACAGTLHHI